ncbi:FusB/FusC family EF-G-binding protein [Mesobacillus foraminis]|uniref:FusB/FusC family EF-G-binding protein n=1 Tax=Mesobacillus foraminis TaxID=279826 RepID=UPI00399F5A40
MEPFIRNDQYNFIRDQIQVLVNGHSSVNDREVLSALKSLVLEKSINLFPDIKSEQLIMLNRLGHIQTKEQAGEYLTQLKQFVIPFKEISLNSLKKLWPKVKKLKMPPLNDLCLKETSYLGWDDAGSQKKYILVYQDSKPIGLQGHFTPSHKKGICAICNKLEVVGMFLTVKKGVAEGTFTKRGNYICHDSAKCNQNLTSLKKLTEFVTLCK